MDEKTIVSLQKQIKKYMEIFNLTQSERLLVKDVWEWSVSQVNIEEIKEDL